MFYHSITILLLSVEFMFFFPSTICLRKTPNDNLNILRLCFVGVWVRPQNKPDFENDRWLFGLCYRSNFPAGFQNESPKDSKVNWAYSVVVWESSEEAPLEPPPNTGSVRDRLTPLVSASLVHRLDTRTRAVLRGNQLHCTEQLPLQMHKICGPPCTKLIPLFTAGFFVFLSEWETCMNITNL